MITVYYKPFEALRPVHIAVLAAAEAALDQADLPAMFGLPPLVLQHATDDLMKWDMARHDGKKVELLSRGARCVAVWVATNQLGYWSFPDPDGWKLGKGVFFFRGRLLSLSDAGFDPTTGVSITQEMAMETHLKLLEETKRLDEEIQDEAACKRLVESLESSETPDEVIATLLGRPRTRLHLNQLCRLLEPIISNYRNGDEKANDWRSRARKGFKKEREGAEKRLRDEYRAMQPVQDVLIAKWISGHGGLLRELGESEPCSLMVRSDWEAVAKTDGEAVSETQSNDSDNFVRRGLKDIFRSLFK
jgi:hypothetical protein